MKLSVIIPTYNEEKYILECLRSLDKQKSVLFEVIVVDDGSSDKTLEMVSKLEPTNYDLKILKQNHDGPAAARNLGARHAKGKILVFVDADMTFDNHFLSRLVKPIVLRRCKGTFSKEEYVSNWENVWARCWNINQGWEASKRHPINYPDEQKVFRAILKSEFDRAGGFSKGGYTDDYSLYNKLGYMAQVAPGAVFFHKNPDGLKEIFYQAKWSAKREYKFGLLGIVFSLVRSSPPFSLFFGLLRAMNEREILFAVFKLVYDFGQFIGVLEMIFLGKQYK